MNPKKPKTLVDALSVDLSSKSAGSRYVILPDGEFSARDGRPHIEGGVWRMSSDIARVLIQILNSFGGDIVIDYEHQTLNAEKNGQPAPAAGWIKRDTFEYKQGVGVTAEITWTTKAKAMIDAGEYRYLSPVINYTKDGEVFSIEHVALTNYAGLDMLPAIAALRAQIQFSNSQSNQTKPETQPETNQEDKTMDKAALCALLGVSVDISDEDLQAKLKACKSAFDAQAALRGELNLNDDQDTVTAVAALKVSASENTNGNVDLSKFVPIATVTALKAELDALKGEDVEDLIASALKAGKLTKSMEPWARALADQDVTALKAYLDAAPEVAALKGTQTKGNAPEGSDHGVHDLSVEELHVAKQMGRTPAEFAALKAQQFEGVK